MLIRLDLDAWINDPPSSSEEEPEEVDMSKQAYDDDYYSPSKERQKDLTADELAQVTTRL